jgi:outer membrane lipoprotein SlyB
MNAMHPSGLPTNLPNGSLPNGSVSPGATVFGANLPSTSPKTHPLILAASIAVIFASATAMASMFGFIGSSAPKATTVTPLTSAIAPVSSANASTVAATVAATSATLLAAPAVASEAVNTPIILAPSASKAIQLPAAGSEAATRNTAPVRPVITRTASTTGPVNSPVTASKPSYPVIAQNSTPPAQDNPASYPVGNAPVQNAPVVAAAPVPDYRSAPAPQPTTQAQYIDPNIGTVTSIREDQRKSQGSGVGAIAGGAVGGALGNQMGKGNGRVAATILGAIGGGLIGNEIEKSQRVVTTYVATVRMPDGAIRNFNFSSRPALTVGDQFDIRTAPQGSQAQYVKPRRSSPPEAVRSDTMRSDNPYNT